MIERRQVVCYLPPGVSCAEHPGQKRFIAKIDGRDPKRPDARAWLVGIRIYPRFDPDIVVHSIETEGDVEQLAQSIRAMDLMAALESVPYPGGPPVWDPIRVGLVTELRARVSGPCDVVGFQVRYDWEVPDGG